MTPWAVPEFLLKSVILGLIHLSLHPAVLRVASTCHSRTKPRTALVETQAHADLGWESPDTKYLTLGTSSSLGLPEFPFYYPTQHLPQAPGWR